MILMDAYKEGTIIMQQGFIQWPFSVDYRLESKSDVKTSKNQPGYILVLAVLAY